MLTFPNAKINLGLNITEKRPDGYHNLETIFYPIPVEDALEINPLREGDGKYCLHQAGMEIAGEAENNLVVKAYKQLDGLFDLPPVDIHLFKHMNCFLINYTLCLSFIFYGFITENALIKLALYCSYRTHCSLGILKYHTYVTAS